MKNLIVERDFKILNISELSRLSKNDIIKRLKRDFRNTSDWDFSLSSEYKKNQLINLYRNCHIDTLKNSK